MMDESALRSTVEALKSAAKTARPCQEFKKVSIRPQEGDCTPHVSVDYSGFPQVTWTR